MSMRMYGCNGSTKGLVFPQYKKHSLNSIYIDAGDVRSLVAPGYRIRNRKQKRRLQKKVTRQTCRAEIRKQLEVLV